MSTSELAEDRISPAGATFAALCRSVAVDGRVPKRAFVPETIGPRLLPRVCIMQWQPPDRLYVRLAGTVLCASYGSEITGRELGEVFTGEPAEESRQHHLHALLGRGLRAQRVEFGTPFGPVAYERLMHPLSDDGGEPCCLGLWLNLLEGPEHRTIRSLAQETVHAPRPTDA